MLVVSYIAANLIYDNGQRLSVVQNMEINEYLRRQKVAGNTIIEVLKQQRGITKSQR